MKSFPTNSEKGSRLKFCMAEMTLPVEGERKVIRPQCSGKDSSYTGKKKKKKTKLLWRRMNEERQ